MNPKLSKLVLDAGVVAGACLFVFGLYLIWHPLAPLVGGLMLLAGCLFLGYDSYRNEKIERMRGSRQ